MGRNEEFDQGRQPYQYFVMPPDHWGNANGKHAVLAYMGEKPIGTLTWDPDGNLDAIEVKAGHRRKGIATEMMAHAARWADSDPSVPRITYAKEYTKLGEKWRGSVGLPPATETTYQGELSHRYASPFMR